MKKKLVIISAAAVLALGGLATIAGAIGSGNMSITKAATAHAEHDHSAMVEKAFQAPTTSAEGYKPFYLCSECCASDFRTSRYSVANKDENLADVVIPALTAATTADIASGDGISAINTQKFKYVDQGANKGEASSDKVESTPLFVKDSGKTAIYFSRSGMAATPNNPTGNDGCSEFRFTVPTEAAKSKSVSFSYKYMNWGTGSWAGSASASEPAGWTALIQFKDSGSYIGHDVSAKLTNDGEWHTLKLDYSGGTTASLTDFIFKFTDLRGYIMVSGLTYEATKDVTLKNVNADGTDGTANVLVGSLPDSPTMDGKTFLGWYDESGNKVESVTSSTTTLVAKWGANSSGSSESFDYMGNLSEKVAALPDKITDDNVNDAIVKYKEYASAASIAEANMTAYEKANYSVPDKVTTVKTSLAGKTTEVLSLPSSGDGWTIANSLGIDSDANFGVSYSSKDYYPNTGTASGTINFINIDLQNGGYKESKTYYVDFPKINYRAYSSVTFKMYSDTGISKDWEIKADGNALYNGHEWINAQWSPLVTISTTEGTTTLVANYYGTKYSVNLSDEVANGTKALRLERTRTIADGDTQLGYDMFAFSSLIATI